ncbi:cytochrome P450 [Favolaschia claudopus]|uniref:Cytochrome P450 n=1 Tax=Favolaschia claudopus TaxID=2862362 RepID=A0AAV9Z5X1_9AGAR
MVVVVAKELRLCAFRKRSERPVGSLEGPGSRYPPGPRPSLIPLVGNLFDIPKTQQWKTFSDWGEQYGDLVMIQLMGKKICIINTYKAAQALLTVKSSIYSDRPAMPMRFNVGLQPATSQSYARQRKLFDMGFSARNTSRYHGIINREYARLLSLLMDGSKYDDHIKKQVIESIDAIVMMIGLGYSIVEDDPFVRIAQQAQLAMVSAARPGAYLVDLFPVLKYIPEWLPGASFQKVAREGRELSKKLQTEPFAWAISQFRKGEAKPSFFKALMDSERRTEQDSEHDTDIRAVTAVMYATAADTIFSSVLTFILAMLHAPEAQKAAQDELDRVISHRLPGLDDRTQLPYLNALVKEALRWELVIPLGVYNGYVIPAGTTIIANQWGMAHDPGTYDQPYEFRPERFLGNHGLPDPASIAFGWGKRACPGRYLAEDALFLFAAMTLTCFTISPVGKGKEGIPPRQYSDGLASRPVPFPCSFALRHPKAKDLIDNNLEYDFEGVEEVGGGE